MVADIRPLGLGHVWGSEMDSFDSPPPSGQVSSVVEMRLSGSQHSSLKTVGNRSRALNIDLLAMGNGHSVLVTITVNNRLSCTNP